METSEDGLEGEGECMPISQSFPAASMKKLRVIFIYDVGTAQGLSEGSVYLLDVYVALTLGGNIKFHRSANLLSRKKRITP